MATALRKTTLATPPPPPRPSLLDRILRAFDAAYRFLASLKLAVFSLAALASVLAYATWFEKWYGTAAVQEWVYRSPGFAILLAFLGANILCAALIRFPWKRRQTGFVITHAGLLIVLLGALWSAKSADEGQFGMIEGDTLSELFRRDDSAIRLRKLDPHTGEVDADFQEWMLPFRPGTFAWGQGQPRWMDPSGWFAHLLALKPLPGAYEEEISKPRDPFKAVVKGFLPSSTLGLAHDPDPSGDPMVKIRPRFKGPGMPQLTDIFTDDERWLSVDRKYGRTARTEFPARFVFTYAEKPEAVDDFLNPPKAEGPEGAVRFRYQDDAGKPRTFDWALDGQTGKTITLPGSDLVVKLEKVIALPTDDIPVSFHGKARSLARVLGESVIPIAEFSVREEDGPPADYYAWGALPNAPNLMPRQREGAGAHEKPLVQISYDVPPVMGAQAGGLRGVVEVLGTPDGKLYYRVFGRNNDGLGVLRGKPGALAKGEEVTAFGGDPGAVMTLVLKAEDYLTAGVEREVAEPVVLPAGKKDMGVAAALVALTVDGATKEVWVQRTRGLEKEWKRVTLPGGVYEIAFDADRKPLGFSLTLEDFDRGFDPGTEKPSRFASTVLLTDPAQGVKDERVTISMNHPLTHRGYTFFQSSYEPQVDPQTGQKTGRFYSILQVATDPGLYVKYFGCIMVVLGAFVQFYMRAGIFSDSARERTRAALRAAKHAGANGAPPRDGQPETTVTDVTESEEAL